MTSSVILLILCHLACAFFAGMETGVVASNRLRLVHLSRNGDSRAKTLVRYIRNPDRLFGTLLVGGNIASVAISTISASIAYSIWGAPGLGASSALSTLTILVVCEFIPKAWFGADPVARSLPFARILRVSEAILSPLSVAMNFIVSLLIPAADKGSGGGTVTREYLRILAGNSEAAGEISHVENIMIGRALALHSRTAADIMIPLADVATLTPDATLADVSRLAKETGRANFPVVEPKSGKCLGVLHIRDVLARIAGNLDEKIDESVRKPFYINASLPADDILPRLRSHGQRMGVVRDKSAAMCGIVTIDAILSLVAGDAPSLGKAATPGAAPLSKGGTE